MNKPELIIAGLFLYPWLWAFYQLVVVSNPVWALNMIALVLMLEAMGRASGPDSGESNDTSGHSPEDMDGENGPIISSDLFGDTSEGAEDTAPELKTVTEPGMGPRFFEEPVEDGEPPFADEYPTLPADKPEKDYGFLTASTCATDVPDGKVHGPASLLQAKSAADVPDGKVHESASLHLQAKSAADVADEKVHEPAGLLQAKSAAGGLMKTPSAGFLQAKSVAGGLVKTPNNRRVKDEVKPKFINTYLVSAAEGDYPLPSPEFFYNYRFFYYRHRGNWREMRKGKMMVPTLEAIAEDSRRPVAVAPGDIPPMDAGRKSKKGVKKMLRGVKKSFKKLRSCF